MVFPDMPPPILLSFNRSDWPEATDEREAFELWRNARSAFSKVHGWPGGVVEMLQEHVRVHHGIYFGPRNA